MYMYVDTAMLWKIGVNMPGLSMYGELISHLVPATNMGQEPSRQLRATPSIWNNSFLPGISTGIADPLLTSEESAMSLPSRALDSAMGSRAISSVAYPGTARQWHHILYSLDPHIETSTTRKRTMACQHRVSSVSCWLTQEVYYWSIAKFRGN